MSVKSKEMLPIKRQDGPVTSDCKLKHFRIAGLLIRFSGFSNRNNVVAAPAKIFDYRKRKVLIGIESCHLSFLIFLNLPLNFVAMPVYVGPGIDKI